MAEWWYEKNRDKGSGGVFIQTLHRLGSRYFTGILKTEKCESQAGSGVDPVAILPGGLKAISEHRFSSAGIGQGVSPEPGPSHPGTQENDFGPCTSGKENNKSIFQDSAV